MQPKTSYAKSGDVYIAYQVVGDGPFDLVFVPGAWSNIEWAWEEPLVARFLHRLASFSRLILFDKRGTGLSDRLAAVPDLEERMDDVRAVMDAAGSKRAALLGVSEGGPMSIQFAATYPDRAIALVLYGSFARFTAAPDYPFGTPVEALGNFVAMVDSGWGKGITGPLYGPTLGNDKHFAAWWSQAERTVASPSAALALIRMAAEIDVRSLLPAIQIPTLIMHRSGDLAVNVGASRYMAERIRGSRLVELPGADHFVFVGDQDGLVGEIEEFLTGVRHQQPVDRTLATIMFADIVSSTELAAKLGDERWTDLLERYYAIVRKQLTAFRGREIKTLGDGVLATFDGPARAIRSARAIREEVKGVGIDVRIGLHTGECELLENDIGGIAVHIADRVAATAQSAEVLVSSTVKDLVVGSGIQFADRGAHDLKGVPGQWQLYLVQ